MGRVLCEERKGKGESGKLVRWDEGVGEVRGW